MQKNSAGYALVPSVTPVGNKGFALTQTCVVFIFLQLLCGSVLAQLVVTGKVSDANGSMVQGVTVSANSISTTTNENGSYSISLPGGNNTLSFTMISFKTREVAVGGRSNINVTLEEDVAKLGEVVVVGYGKQSREKLTTAISRLDPKTLENIPYSNAASALQGTVSGVTVQSRSGQPGIAPPYNNKR